MQELLSKFGPESDQPPAELRVHSHCCYCAMQCAIELQVDPVLDRITEVQPVKDFPVASGKACIKGIVAHEHASHEDRLTVPLIRKDGQLTPATWEEALDEIASRFQRVQKQHGHAAVSVFGGGSLTNEKTYLLGKFARVALQTPNIDYNGRYCMSSAATAMNKVFGLDRGMTIPLHDIPLARCILIVGANLADCQPTIMPYLRQAKANGSTIIVVDPRRTATADLADLHLAVKPGTDLALMNGLLHVLIRDNLIDRSFIEQRTRGFEAVEQSVSAYTPERVASQTDIDVETIEHVARLYAEAETALLYTARGIEQQARGVNNVISCLNLVLAAGKIGRPGSGYGAVTGQGNGQGGREHGQKADQLPGYRSIMNEQDRRHITKVWEIDEQELPYQGKSAFELFEAMVDGEIRALFVMASNPVASSPNSSLVKQALHGLDTLVVVDLFLTETAELADIVLPGSAWTEDEGTMTNLEGRVILRRAAHKPPGQARLDWKVLCDLAERMRRGRYFSYQSAEDIFEELCRASKGARADYAGISYDKIEQQKGVFWPCPDPEHPGTERMFVERFGHPDGRAVFYPAEYKEPPEAPNDQYPYTLTTGRIMAHYLTGAQTRRTASLNAKCPEPFVEIHPDLAVREGIADGEFVTLTTRRGQACFQAKITASIREDTLFVPIHWEYEQSINQLTQSQLDPESRMPEFKLCAVAIAKGKA